MTDINKPNIKKSSCSYCGNAPVSHLFYFLESTVSITLDIYAKKFLRYVPFFVKYCVDLVPEILFRTLAIFRLARFSRDITKAHTFRSRIIWEEAEKRGITMEQVIFLGRPLDYYRAKFTFKNKDKTIYFESIPIRPELSDMTQTWDDKVTLKKEFRKHGIPVPGFSEFLFLGFLQFTKRKKIKKIFSQLSKPLIVKPRVGSRGRHTIINISSLEQLREGICIAGRMSPYLIIEEHLEGSVCRATFVGGVLAGFYRAQAPTLLGDGKKTIRELIILMDQNRPKRVHPILLTKELEENISRLNFRIDDILPDQKTLPLTHRMGRFFGGQTKEMVEDIHPSFIPILRRAAEVTGLAVVGFDAIIPDPTKSAETQRWGIIECNTLPFIDLHYYALEGKPKNIAGMIWDLW